MNEQFTVLPCETEVANGVVTVHYKIPAGRDVFSHVHDYDHLSILVSGEGDLTRGDGDPERLTGPRFIEIKAGVRHKFHAVTDCVWDCKHAMEQEGEGVLGIIREGVFS